MGSATGKKAKNPLKKAVVNFHQKHSHNDRVSILAELMGQEINKLYPNHDTLKCLDVGCGDMQLAELIEAGDASLQWTCVDIYRPEGIEGQERWKKYQQFDGQHLPFEDNTFDALIICDVLHHDQENMVTLLKEAKRVAKYVLVKDHYEYGFYSRQILRLMDFVGNWGYDVSIPKRYFSKKSFQATIKAGGLRMIDTRENIDLYKGKPHFKMVVRKKWQFIGVLESAGVEKA